MNWELNNFQHIWIIQLKHRFEPFILQVLFFKTTGATYRTKSQHVLLGNCGKAGGFVHQQHYAADKANSASGSLPGTYLERQKQQKGVIL